MIQYALIKRSSRFLRWYRTGLLLDMKRLRANLPAKGRILDVGCGVGSVDYELARANPDLLVHGIDITPESITMAQQFHSRPNVKYECRRLEEVDGQFDCVLFIDVFHHVPPAYRDSLLNAAARLLKPQGYVLIKDISRRGGWASFALDHYVSKYPANEIFLETCEDLSGVVAKHLKVVQTERRYRFPFPRYYIKAARLEVAG
jgi:2-polyprenyl-3-methyl-5-hydroxy-6-metoxy-1,4-benzoquinol methylase